MISKLRQILAPPLLLAVGFFMVVYVTAMFRAILDTPEPGWEWALAWEYTMSTFLYYWGVMVRW